MNLDRIDAMEASNQGYLEMVGPIIDDIRQEHAGEFAEPQIALTAIKHEAAERTANYELVTRFVEKLPFSHFTNFEVTNSYEAAALAANVYWIFRRSDLEYYPKQPIPHYLIGAKTQGKKTMLLLAGAPQFTSEEFIYRRNKIVGINRHLSPRDIVAQEVDTKRFQESQANFVNNMRRKFSTEELESMYDKHTGKLLVSGFVRSGLNKSDKGVWNAGVHLSRNTDSTVVRELSTEDMIAFDVQSYLDHLSTVFGLNASYNQALENRKQQLDPVGFKALLSKAMRLL